MSLQDSIRVPAYLTILAATIFIGLYVWSSFRTSMADVVGLTPENSTVVNSMNSIQNAMSSFDYMFPIIVVGLLIVSLIFAYKTGASVLYAVVSLVFWAFALLMSAVFTNIFGAFETSFPTVAVTIPVISYIMNNMKWLVLGWLFLISIVMFTRNKAEDERISAAERMMYGGGFG